MLKIFIQNIKRKNIIQKYVDDVKVVIPVFPGTNCEFDSARAFERAGAEADIVVIRNQTPEQLKESIDESKLN